MDQLTAEKATNLQGRTVEASPGFAGLRCQLGRTELAEFKCPGDDKPWKAPVFRLVAFGGDWLSAAQMAVNKPAE